MLRRIPLRARLGAGRRGSPVVWLSTGDDESLFSADFGEDADAGRAQIREWKRSFRTPRKVATAPRTIEDDDPAMFDVDTASSLFVDEASVDSLSSDADAFDLSEPVPYTHPFEEDDSRFSVPLDEMEDERKAKLAASYKRELLKSFSSPEALAAFEDKMRGIVKQGSALQQLMRTDIDAWASKMAEITASMNEGTDNAQSYQDALERAEDLEETIYLGDLDEPVDPEDVSLRRLQEELEVDREDMEVVLRQHPKEDPLLGSSQPMDSSRILLTPDEELDELDLEYKRAVLGGVSKADVDSVGRAPKRPLEEYLDLAPPKAKVPPPKMVLPEQDLVNGKALGYGSRKTAKAWVTLSKGSGHFWVNGKEMTEYFPRITSRVEMTMPFQVNECGHMYDVKARVQGGGKSGQAGAVRLALARALQKMDPQCRAALKEHKLLTRDPRNVERKKPGRVKARKRQQWSKR